MDAKQLGALTPRVDRAVLLALAERCEREEPSRELDALILMAIRGYTPHEANDYTRGVFAFWENGSCVNCSHWDSPTSNRDEAAALMPEDLSVSIATGGKQGKLTYVEVFISEDTHWCDSQAPTEAQARTAAALRAMAG